MVLLFFFFKPVNLTKFFPSHWLLSHMRIFFCGSILCRDYIRVATLLYLNKMHESFFFLVEAFLGRDQIREQRSTTSIVIVIFHCNFSRSDPD